MAFLSRLRLDLAGRRVARTHLECRFQSIIADTSVYGRYASRTRAFSARDSKRADSVDRMTFGP